MNLQEKNNVTSDDYVYAYTDGACSGNPGPGGWGVVLRYQQQEKHLSGGEAMTTNNRMELMAAIQAIRTLKKPMHLVIVTDSKYVQQGIEQWLSKWLKNNWKTANNQPVKNQDLWQALFDACQYPLSIQWRWVKGHAGHPENEKADELARSALLPFKNT